MENIYPEKMLKTLRRKIQRKKKRGINMDEKKDIITETRHMRSTHMEENWIFEEWREKI